MSEPGRDQGAGEPPPPDAPDVITQQAFIDGLLESLCAARSLIQVGVDTGSPVYCSTVLAVDHDARALVLDELNPDCGHARLINARHGHVVGTRGRVLVRFPIRLLDVGHKDGVYYYRVARPAWIRYAQRRDLFRVGVTGIDTRVSMPCPGGTTLEGRITDLSAGGIGAAFPARTVLTPGAVFNACVLRFGQGRDLTCALQITHVCGDSTSNGPVRVGTRFTGLDSTQRATVRQHVAALEREALRRGQRR